MRDFYKVLGIASTADDGRIKTAFRCRAKAFHPDLNPGDRRAEERFKELTEAYEVLRSAHARATYDAYRAQRRSAVRRRVASSAALMAASFVLTLGSAFAVLAAHDTGSPLREGWKVVVTKVASAFVGPADGQADEWAKATSVTLAGTSETEIAKASPKAAGPSETVKTRQRAVADGNAALKRARATQEGKAEAPVEAKAARKLAAAGPAPRPAASSGADRKEAALQSMVAIGDESRTWPAEDAPRMGLGATGR